MKKAIALLSALAITASQVMPFCVVAEDQLEIEAFTQWDNEWTVANFFEKTGAKALEKSELPAKVTTPNNQSAWIIYAATDTKLSIATYKATGEFYSTTSGTEEYIQTQLGKGKNFYYFYEDSYIPPDPTDPAPVTPKDGTTVNYLPDASFVVIIPESVVLHENKSVTRSIRAENVKLNNDKSLFVKLTGAKNEAGDDEAANKVFSAMTEDKASTANYTIFDSKGKAVGLDTTVATFESSVNGVEQSYPLIFSKPSGATYVGEHKETLTFTIGVEDKGIMFGGEKLANGGTLTVTKGTGEGEVSGTFEYTKERKLTLKGQTENGVAPAEGKELYVITANIDGDKITVTFNHKDDDDYDMTVVFNTVDSTYTVTKGESAGSLGTVSVNGKAITLKEKTQSQEPGA